MTDNPGTEIGIPLKNLKAITSLDLWKDHSISKLSNKEVQNITNTSWSPTRFMPYTIETNPIDSKPEVFLRSSKPETTIDNKSNKD